MSSERTRRRMFARIREVERLEQLQDNNPQDK